MLLSQHLPEGTGNTMGNLDQTATLQAKIQTSNSTIHVWDIMVELNSGYNKFKYHSTY
jgi:hypothetical protein